MIPHDLDAESAVIGCCLASSDAARWAVEWLSPADFHSEKHLVVMEAIRSLYAEGKRIDPITVADRAKTEGWKAQGLASDLTSALANAPAPSGIERYGGIVRRHSVARAAQKLCADAAGGFGDPSRDPDDLLDSLVSELQSIDAHVPTGKPPGFMTFEELRAKPPETRAPWVLPGLLRSDWRATFVGVEGSGKSILIRALAVAAAAGMLPFGGQEPQVPVRSLLVDLENPEDHLLDWVDRLSHHAEQWRRTTEGRGAVFHRPGGLDLRKRANRSQLEQVLRDHRPDLVCIGPLYKAYRRASSRETDEEAAGEMQEIFDDLRTRHHFALVIEHHAPKAQGGSRPLDPFGSSLWLRWGEIRMSLVPPDRSFPVWSMELRPFSGSRVEHGWPDRVDRNRQSSGMPWLGWWKEGL